MNNLHLSQRYCLDLNQKAYYLLANPAAHNHASCICILRRINSIVTTMYADLKFVAFRRANLMVYSSSRIVTNGGVVTALRVPTKPATEMPSPPPRMPITGIQ